jgi:SpoU rRNA methylase family enzyme
MRTSHDLVHPDKRRHQKDANPNERTDNEDLLTLIDVDEALTKRETTRQDCLFRF